MDNPGARLRAELEGAILCGTLPPGHRLPPETELAVRHGCSRMTVNKVLVGLVAAGLVTRRRRAGSFVCQPPGEQAMLSIGDLAADAARLGARYCHEVTSRRVVQRPDGAEALHVTCRHLADDLPLAFEDRLILLNAVPEARDESFIELPPSPWLLRVRPWSRAEHVLRARAADPAMARHLAVPRGTACLVLERQTWHQDAVVTQVSITYPGERHAFVGQFEPGSGLQTGPIGGDAPSRPSSRA